MEKQSIMAGVSRTYLPMNTDTGLSILVQINPDFIDVNSGNYSGNCIRLSGFHVLI